MEPVGHSNSNVSDQSSEKELDVKGEQLESNSLTSTLDLNWIDMWALGVTISVAGTYFAWNVGLTAGFGTFIIDRFLVSMAYVCMILSVAELSSGLPFAGEILNFKILTFK